MESKSKNNFSIYTYYNFYHKYIYKIFNYNNNNNNKINNIINKIRVKIAVNSENDEIIAVKIISKQNAKVRKNLEREIALHQCLHHENIIQLKRAVEDKNFVYMMMEYAAGGELFDKIGIQKYAKFCFREIYLILNYLFNYTLLFINISG